MIFEEIIHQYNDGIKEAVDELLINAYENQKNNTDLLLVLQNGLKKDYPVETLERLNITPYQIGVDIIDFRYHSFYDFINVYRENVYKKAEHKSELEKNSFDRNYIYHYHIEQELLIYMKFWETDLILRRLYNLSRLAQGIEYFWEYNQTFFNARRMVIKDEIQKDLEDISPKFFNLINEIYSRQIRNAIAHSQYYLMYDCINLTNIDESIYYKLNTISYDDWEILFHKNILLYSHLIRGFNEYSLKYQEQVEKKQNGLLIVFPEINSKGINNTGWVKYDKVTKQWIWNQ